MIFIKYLSILLQKSNINSQWLSCIYCFLIYIYRHIINMYLQNIRYDLNINIKAICFYSFPLSFFEYYNTKLKILRGFFISINIQLHKIIAYRKQRFYILKMEQKYYRYSYIWPFGISSLIFNLNWKIWYESVINWCSTFE